ncbi:hypothetical protein DFP72DRAFT_880474 [Ephemerocybe angulata]|uniref:Transmembrane protein n=1 Tax=Ephemerocybe angulata TaxID=980116 RepID=A0A8H6MEQ8_9AGAR|nr:hypothetical protein DFP72DRAFT_880474 [Tulosesus angulatus]
MSRWTERATDAATSITAAIRVASKLYYVIAIRIERVHSQPERRVEAVCPKGPIHSMPPRPVIVSYPSAFAGPPSCRNLDECLALRGGLWLSPLSLWLILGLFLAFVLGSMATFLIRRFRRRRAAQKTEPSKTQFMTSLERKLSTFSEVAPAYTPPESSPPAIAVHPPPPSYRRA